MVQPYITKQRKYFHLCRLSTVVPAAVAEITYLRRYSVVPTDIRFGWAARSCAQASELADGTKTVWNAASSAVHDPYTQRMVALPNNNAILCRPVRWPTVPCHQPRSYAPQGCTWQNGKPQGAAHHPTLTTVRHR